LGRARKEKGVAIPEIENANQTFKIERNRELQSESRTWVNGFTSPATQEKKSRTPALNKLVGKDDGGGEFKDREEGSSQIKKIAG